MAQGTLLLFHEFSESIGDGRLDLDTDNFFCALVDTIPAVTDPIPTWGAGGSTDLSLLEVSGTNYTPGGEALTEVWSQTTGTATFDSTANPSWTQNGAGPADVRAAVIYSDTAANKDAIGFIDMTVDAGTTPLSLIDADIDITFNASGIFTLS